MPILIEETDSSQFSTIVDAMSGEIFIDDGKEAPKAPPKMWDLYGEKSE